MMKTNRSTHSVLAYAASLFISLVASQGLAQLSQEECLEEIGWLPDRPAFAIAASGRYVYFADGSTFVVADVSDPADPYQVGEVTLPKNVGRIAVEGDFAYVVDGSGLLIIDVSEPAQPYVQGSLPTLGSAQGVAVGGAYAFVADGGSGLLIINVSDPSNPFFEGSFSEGGDVTAVAVAESGQYAYVVESFGLHQPEFLQIVDVADPFDPIKRGDWVLDPGNGLHEHIVASAEFGGGYLFVWINTDGYLANYSYIFDVHDPAAPQILPKSRLDWVGFLAGLRGLVVSGQTAYLLDSGYWGSSVYAVDVTDPSAPIVAADLFRIGTHSFGLAASAGHVYTADGANLHIYRQCPNVFTDGFESGDTSWWSTTVP